MEFGVVAGEFFREDGGDGAHETGHDGKQGGEDLGGGEREAVDGEDTSQAKGKGGELDGGEAFVEDEFADEVPADDQGGIEEKSCGADGEVFKAVEVGRLVKAACKGNNGKPFDVFFINRFEEAEFEVGDEDEGQEKEAAGPGLGEFAEVMAHEAGPDAVGGIEKGGDKDEGGAFEFGGHDYFLTWRLFLEFICIFVRLTNKGVRAIKIIIAKLDYMMDWWDNHGDVRSNRQLG